MVNSQLFGAGNLCAAVPADIWILNLGDIVFQKIVNAPPAFLVCFECLGPDGIAGLVYFAFALVYSRLEKIQIGIRPIKVFPKRFELRILLSRFPRRYNHIIAFGQFCFALFMSFDRPFLYNLCCLLLYIGAHYASVVANLSNLQLFPLHPKPDAEIIFVIMIGRLLLLHLRQTKICFIFEKR